MSETLANRNPLQREGTKQSQRILDYLLPENVKLHELSSEDWLVFAKDLASLISYYDLADSNQAIGDWDDFFVEKEDVAALLAESEDETKEPHLALFVAFLKLLEFPQESLNGIPKRHLDFYFSEILKLSKRAFTPDSVHLIFELAKTANSELVEEKSRLKAGKDASGKLRSYEIDQKTVVNTAKVASIKSALLDNTGSLRYALDSKKLDGLEIESEGDLSWSAFGQQEWPTEGDEEQWPKWLPSLLIASDVFSMSEGERQITLNWSLSKKMNLKGGTISAELSLEKSWSDPLAVTVSGSLNEVWSISIPADFDPIVGYSEEVHLARLDTIKASLRIRFSNPENYSILQDLSVKSLDLDVSARGLKNLILRNELGLQSIDKPFMPFGPRPKKNSPCIVEARELDGKSLSSLSLDLKWLDIPSDLDLHYSAYSDLILDELNNSVADKNRVQELVMKMVLRSTDPLNLDEEIRVEVSSEYSNNVEAAYEIFASSSASIELGNIDPTARKGEIELRLTESFFHHLYSKVYVQVVTGVVPPNAVNPDDLPNEPYTPLLDSLSLNYSAKASVNFADPDSVGGDVLIYEASPFGTKQFGEVATMQTRFSTHQMYIGLEGSKARQVVNLLFQVAEGSENPEHSSFGPGEDIRWSVLTNDDQWQILGENDLVRNETNNFLKSGIISFSLPKETGLEHLLFDSTLVWLRAELFRQADSVSRFIDIHAQADRATFVDDRNSLEHLETGLEAASISQLAQRKSKIKSVSQPYPSFAGKPAEKDDEFYRRISERLRHKDRASSIWDFERIVLQEFPNIFKAKCLNHSSFENDKVDEMAPGRVSVVVIPRLSDLSSSFRLKPQVSQNTRDEIHAFLSSRQSMHVKLGVLNPIYEEVQFTFKVRFLSGHDYNFYRTTVQEDITRFLAPWVHDENVDISFDNQLYIYDAINYLENLNYLDYVEDFSMSHKPSGKSWEVKKSISPSNAMAVLVPADSHLISEANTC